MADQDQQRQQAFKFHLTCLAEAYKRCVNLASLLPLSAISMKQIRATNLVLKRVSRQSQDDQNAKCKALVATKPNQNQK